MSTSILSRAAVVACVVALVLASHVATAVEADASSSSSGLANITAGYECNADCSQCNSTGTMVQGGCTWVPPASMYVMYTCINGNTQVQLEAFGPLKFMCSSSDPLHLTYKYNVNTCVLPPAGGYTIYHCPS
ncbi:membrane-associated protein, putative [Bodo saltans]|uniref:Membrane-associated protein, putative n=1 Tax=Bodo saltans TaxID=75058 RepID=A0A0S4IM88_BODSA|nr:membrane-associated protein, putative [Bodo saltans]|eukprot:CUF40180.1 membrane-associated protein, putative [Bodo saltans]